MELTFPSSRRPVGIRHRMQAGTFVLQVEEGVQLSVVATVTFTDPPCPLAIHAGKGSRATVFLRLSPGAVEQQMDVRLEQDASLQLVCLQQGSALQQDVRQQCTVGAGASLRLFNLTLGGHVRHTLASTVEGEGGMSTVDWLFRAQGTDVLALTAHNVFLARRGGGEVTMKGVAEQRSWAACHGSIVIGEKGGGTSTYLTQKVLMLDATANVEAVPGLEIKTNDVKASHSATVTKVHEEDLFYFGARGIDRGEARAMYVHGFLQDTLSRITDVCIREEVERVLSGVA